MIRQFISTFVALAASVLLGLGFVATAHAQSIDEILAEPKVDDIFSARLDHFSEYDFGDGSEAAYGMLRVVAVDRSTITVITESSAWDSRSDALKDLRGNFSDVDWDHDEEISINRSELAGLKRDGMIFGARRLTASQIKEYLD